MKGLLIVILAFASFNTFALEQCTPEVQTEIDTVLSKITTESDDMKKIDLEFEVRKLAHTYKDCRKSQQPEVDRDIASFEMPEMVVERDLEAEEVAELQAKANQEIEEVLNLK